MALTEHDGERDGTDRQAPEYEARDVQASVHRIGALGQHDGGTDEREHAEDEVEPEDRPPRPDPDEDTADDRPESKGKSRDRRPDAERLRPLAPVRVDVADDRERSRL